MQPELLSAYLATDYCAADLSNRPLILRIGQRSEPLSDLLRDVGKETAAFISAYNPYSAPTSLAQNRDAQAILKLKLLEMTSYVLEGEGRGRDGDWPAEPSFLVIGIDYAAACAIGREFGQHAIVFAGADAVPSLVFVGGGDLPP